MRTDFLLCSERSGSNLMTQIMGSHPEVCGPAPKHLARLVLTNINKFGELARDENWNELLVSLSRLINCGFSQWEAKIDFDLLKQACTVREFRNLLDTIFGFEVKAQGKTRLFLKEILVHRFLLELLTIYEDSRFVFMVRDPRDVIASYKSSSQMPHWSSGLFNWRDDQQKYIQFSKSLPKSPKRLHFLRYEELVSNPQNAVTEICDFLQLEFCESMMEFHRNRTAIKMSEVNGNWENVSKPIQSGNFGKYKSKLTVEEIWLVEAYCHEEMKYLGYNDFESDLNSFDPEKVQSQFRKAQADAQNYQPDFPENMMKMFGMEAMFRKLPLKLS